MRHTTTFSSCQFNRDPWKKLRKAVGLPGVLCSFYDECRDRLRRRS